VSSPRACFSGLQVDGDYTAVARADVNEENGSYLSDYATFSIEEAWLVLGPCTLGRGVDVHAP
jgi:hypothetical protein